MLTKEQQVKRIQQILKHESFHTCDNCGKSYMPFTSSTECPFCHNQDEVKDEGEVLFEDNCQFEDMDGDELVDYYSETIKKHGYF